MTGRSEGSGVTESDPEDPEVDGRFEVVVNQEEQYSIWPAEDRPPEGWQVVGVCGSKAECLDHIERVWTDMRPRSLRDRAR
jgi:MbtH protein